MKKAIATAAALALSLGLFACRGGSAPAQDSGSSSTAVPAASEPAAAKKDFDGANQAEVGEGDVILATPAGTSEGGNVPKMTVTADTMLTQVEVDTQGLEVAPVTYIYVDGIQATKGNYGDAQLPIDLSGDTVKAGSHQVEVVQFANDDPAGEVTFCRSIPFEIANAPPLAPSHSVRRSWVWLSPRR